MPYRGMATLSGTATTESACSASIQPSARPTIPTEWTAFRSSRLPNVPTSWWEHDAPSELSVLPETFRIPPKLEEIIRWSLHRPLAPEAPVPSNGLSRADKFPGPTEEESPHVAEGQQILSEGRIETNSAVSDSRSTRSSSLERAVPKLRTIKHDLVSSAVSKITALKEKHDRDRVASKTLKNVPIPTEKTKTGECTSCFEDLPLTELVNLPCTHKYCKPCLATLITTALQNESAFPPKCCLSEIPPATVIIPLDKKLRELYKEKAAEYSIPASARWYCPNTKCLKWIPPSKLNRSRGTEQKCPHCQSKVCRMCRGPGHARNVDCPQDFGLEATMSIAESEGWRRCHNCRTMVERTTGCRHITCKCGAEFCYVCGSRWRTCNCTEVDEANRQALLRRQRQDRDAADQAEADEVARAIAVVEALERQEAEERRQREEELERERQREEMELARLEQIRLEEEASRQREREEAERQLRNVLRLSIQEDVDALMASLKDLLHTQHIALDDRQGAEEQKALSDFERTREVLSKNSEMLQANMQKNVNRRIDQLKAKQVQGVTELERKQEDQEDDVFLQIQQHLKGKPNREAREKRLVESMKREQDQEQRELRRLHEEQMKSLEQVAEMEVKGLKRVGEARMARAQGEFENKMDAMKVGASIERRWFEVVWTRRVQMMEDHGQSMVREFEQSREPVGLTEELARMVLPLPAKMRGDDQKTRQSMVSTIWSDSAGERSIQSTPIELEAPILPPKPTRAAPSISGGVNEFTSTAKDAKAIAPVVTHDAASATTQASNDRARSDSSFMTAETHISIEDQLTRNPWAWAMGSKADANAQHSSRLERSTLAPTTLTRHLTPPSPTKDDGPCPMPHNGNAYLCVKNGESSRPMYLPPSPPNGPTAPPTPPDSPLVPMLIQPSQQSQSTHPYERLTHAARSMTNLKLRLPSRLSIGESSIETTLTPTPTDRTSRDSSQIDVSSAGHEKPRRAPVPVTTGNMYMDSFLDVSSLKNKAPIDNLGAQNRLPGSFDASLPSAAPKEGQKKSRWPFRRREYTEDEIKQRMTKVVGDAFV